MPNNTYIIYEEAMTPEITDVKRSAKGVEFITVLQEADVKNRNGRIYPKSVVDHALQSPLVQEHLRKKDFIGECGHPFSQDIARQTQIDLNNACFRINEFWWEDNILKGRCETLNNAKGRDMAALIEQGMKVSFSMRGQGNVVRDPARDALVVQEPLMLICYDWVALPSHQCAYLEKICEETKVAMFKENVMSLNECYSLYENGALIEMASAKTVEKPTKDYYTSYSRKLKTLNEKYFYDPRDKVVEMNNNYVLLEGADCFKKVAKDDYLLKSMRNEFSESCAGIAPCDITMNCTTDTDGDNNPEMSSEDTEYKNPMEAEVTNRLGKSAKNVSAGTSIDEVDGVELPEGILERKPKEENIDIDNDDVIDTVDSAEDVVVEEAYQEALKEEFYNTCTLISEETGLTDINDIIAYGLDYSDYMSEDCALMFKELSKEDL